MRKVANTEIIKNTPEYQKIAKKYRILAGILIFLLVVAVIFSSILSARVVEVSEINEEIYNRDIMLCMDVSGSMDELNSEIIDSYVKIVEAMNGERFGVSIFNASSYLLVPLTDDYEYVLDALKTLKSAYEMVADGYESASLEEYSYLRSYLMDGTMTGDGASKAGEGLAACVYSFPNTDAERARAVVLSTDNEVYGEEIVDVIGAAKIAKEKNAKLYVLAPETAYGQMARDLKSAAELTGGEMYVQGNSGSVDGVIAGIEETERTLIKGTSRVVETDQVTLLYIILIMVALVTIVVEVILG